jgi:ABC-type antimicrobial peptide transport system permease subunit
MVVRNGMTLMSAGIAGGLLAALGATQVLAALLYEVQPTDALTYLSVALVLAAVGAAAAVIPAWGASRADPASTLRAE